MSARTQRAIQLYSQYRLREAEKEAGRILAGAPEDHDAHGILALILSRQKRHEEAEREAREVLRLLPNHPYGHSVLARVHLGKLDFAAAEKSAGEALALAPRNAGHHFLLAGIFFRQSRWDRALAHAEHGLSLNPRNAHGENLRAIALQMLGQAQVAEGSARTALDIAPLSSAGHATLGFLYLEDGHVDAAIESLREALRLNPNSDYARRGMIEARKAKVPGYNRLRRGMLWFARLPDWGRFLAIAALWLVPQAIWGTRVAVHVFLAGVYLVFLTVPVSNFLFSLSRTGRMMLTETEIRWGTWTSACVFPAVVFLALSLYVYPAPFARDFGALAFFLALAAFPAAIVFWPTARFEQGRAIIASMWLFWVAWATVDFLLGPQWGLQSFLTGIAVGIAVFLLARRIIAGFNAPG